MLSSVELSAHEPTQAQAELERATREQPKNPASWSALAQFLVQRHLWRPALSAADRVQALDVTGDTTEVNNNALIAEITPHLTAASSATTPSSTRPTARCARHSCSATWSGASVSSISAAVTAG